MPRWIILTIDDMTRLIYDYSGEALELPEDVKPDRLMFRPTDKGKLGLLLYSETWDKDQPPEEIRFDLRRIYGVS